MGLYYPDGDRRLITYGFPTGFGKGFDSSLVSSKLTYLLNATVQTDLKVTMEQLGKLKALSAKQSKDAQALRDLPVADLFQKSAALRKETDQAIAGILNPEQNKRLGQIVRQQLGSRLFTDKTLLAALQLTEEQRAKLNAVRAKYVEQSTDLATTGLGGTPEYVKRLTQARKAAFDAAVTFLTPQQKAAWQDLVGEPFQGYVATWGRGADTGFKGRAPKSGKGLPGGALRSRPFEFNNWNTSNSRYLTGKSVQAELKLTPEQLDRIAALPQPAGAMPDNLLTPAQLNRYQEIYLQASMRTYGPAAPLRYRQVLDLLKLSDEQKAKVLAIGQEDSTGYAALRNGADAATDLGALNKSTTANLHQVLTAEQRSKLKELIGQPFTGIVQPTGRSRFEQATPGVPGRDATPDRPLRKGPARRRTNGVASRAMRKAMSPAICRAAICRTLQ